MARFEAGRRVTSAGVTLPELLVVITIIALAVTIAVPLMSGAVRSANARAAANGFAMNLKAARMIAVTNNAPVDVTVVVEPHPDCDCTPTYYEYPGRDGGMRRFDMPPGVTITSSTSPIRFMPDGSVEGGSSSVIKAQVSPGVVEVWTIDSRVSGVSTVELSREP